MKYIIIFVSGYLIGSISPSYFLGKIIKGIDIREHGDNNAGTLNTLHVLGLFPAIITALFDLTKGLIVALLAYYIGIPYPYNFLFAYIAVLGHIFPFYLKFRGGQGAATAIGVILYFLATFIKRGVFPLDALIILTILVLVVFYITKNGEIIGISTIPVLIFFSVYFAQGSPESL
ncbi:MAG TPA: glycerol-3-phosphate acyltransferase, partial [Candidatus Atribacteria bacterium]|nr:glycerol-3-phosphate acyltransferase [Candidatus Atribacteria bacterium]